MTGPLAVIVHLSLGSVLGYLAATWVESFAHQHVSDARPRVVKRWARHPRLFKYLIRTHYSHHTVHHLRTFRQDHVTQFRSTDERHALDEELRVRGAHGRMVLESGYAVKLHGTGALVFVSPLLPVAFLLHLALGGWVCLGAVPAMLLPPLLSNYAHPYLHMSHREALARAPRWLAWLLATRYFRAMARNHFMHHRYMNSNFNLLLGGDFLRGAHRRPNSQDLAEMRRIGLRVD